MIKKIHLVAAARPNFMKVAPLYHALRATDWAQPVLIHTGQHYDRNMSDAILEDLRVPAPDYHLGIGSGTHAEQTGNVMIAYEKICIEDRPDWLIVVGDVNPTAACAMVAAKLWIPSVHLEAGLRSRDRTMPEEINRLVTDAIVDVFWTPSADATENLLNEGVDASKIDMIGNIMIDSFEMLRKNIEESNTIERLGLNRGEYALVTLHRPSNVDSQAALKPIVEQLIEAAAKLPIVFVAHPRTMKGLDRFGLMEALQSADGMQVQEPIPYKNFMNLVTQSRMVITDSGGLQEETSYLRIPCLTLRENTERPITVDLGTNELVAAASLGEKIDQILRGDWKAGSDIPFWDGQTAARAVESLRGRISK